ncbi:hypothetical protein Taro_000879 [Colocasia esculenta]|uniref:CCHC-type domain-containing protein n=1 Tax=Colocasia esculenta TaxID=4460 RepID=A0A843THP3_COLES|nr:hypothetical protein [Colocasia esculenta]
MESNKGYMAEGHLVTRPPFFDGTDYPYWKNRMQVFLRAQNFELWEIVKKGAYELPEVEDTWTKDQIAKGTLNWSALNMMQCVVHPKEYSRVSTCTSAKEMWDKLELIYEGTSEVRESKVSMLVSEYEMFKMNHDETISDMFARFMIIINGLKGLKKEYSESDLVRKILRSLPSSWNTKATVSEDSKDHSKMKVDELIGSLMTYELNVKRKGTEENPRKPLALKASRRTSSVSKKELIQESEVSESSSESDNDEMAMLTRKFKKFLKFKRRGTCNSKPFQKKDFSNKFDSNKKSEVVCYECKKQRHMRGECPELKKKLKKDKFTFKKAKAMVATWSDEDEDQNSQATSGDDEVHCLMARSDDSNEVNSSFETYSIIQWEEAYTVLFEKYCEFKSENKALKKKFNSLVHESNNHDEIESLNKVIEMMKLDEQTHSDELDSMKLKFQEVQKERDDLMNSLESLNSEHEKLKEKLEKAENDLKGSNVYVARHEIGFQKVKPKEIGKNLLTNFIDTNPSSSKRTPSKNRKNPSKGKKQESKMVKFAPGQSKEFTTRSKQDKQQTPKAKLTRQQKGKMPMHAPTKAYIHDSPPIHLHITPGRHCSELQFKNHQKSQNWPFSESACRQAPGALSTAGGRLVFGSPMG